MKRVIFALALGTIAWGRVLAATNEAPDFNEVRELIRAHLSGVTDADLNRAAVGGLVTGFHGQVAMAHDAVTASPTNTISKTNLLEGGVAYVQVAYVGGDLAKDLGVALRSAAFSKAKGLALDLRYAEGDDYAAAVAAAELFETKPARLLDWNGHVAETKGSKDAFSAPVAVLVNGQTSGSAEALAAVLRATGAGLILGAHTAGRAAVMTGYPLKSGQELKIASGSVKLGDGSALSPDGVKPDIAVTVKADEERAYFVDAFASLVPTNSLVVNLSTNEVAGTNRPAGRKRMSEAELVRKHRAGEDEDELPLTAEPEPDSPPVRDPVLLRAVDLLKGLAVVRQAQTE